MKKLFERTKERTVKLWNNTASMRHIKIYACIFSVIVVAVVSIVIGINVSGSQQNNETEASVQQQSSVSEPPTVKQVIASLFTEETKEEETSSESATETMTEAVKEEPPIIELEDLDIAEEDLSNEQEVIPEQIEIIDPVKEETIQLPTNEISQLVYGIDVSKWQGNIDWARVKASGVEFAMIKMGGRSTGSSGELYVDSYFERNIEGALANGIQVGVYFFSQAVNEQEALEEASMIINYIKKYKITYPVAFDWESASGYRVAGAGISRDKLTNIVSVFCDTVSGHGYTPMVYFCRNDWYHSVNADVLTAKYKTWLAVYFNQYYYTSKTYTYGEDLPSFQYPFNMWQYGVSNAVDGIDGYVDMNIAFFTYSNSKVDTKEPELNVSNRNITINLGGSFNAMNGVSASNFLGYDVTDKINWVIIDKDGDEVGQDYACSHIGKYTIRYSFIDPSGKKLEETCELIVRDTPDIYYSGEFWPGSDERILEYTFDNSKTEEANYNMLMSAINDKVKGYSYEKNEIKPQMSTPQPSDMYTTVNGKKVLKDGTYSIGLYFDDGKGLSNSKVLTVVIKSSNTLVTPVFNILSVSDNENDKLSNKAYIFKCKANTDGMITIELNGEKVLEDTVYADRIYSYDSITLESGKNNFVVKFTPDAGFMPGGRQELSSYDTIVKEFSVWYYNTAQETISPTEKPTEENTESSTEETTEAPTEKPTQKPSEEETESSIEKETQSASSDSVKGTDISSTK